MNIPSTISSLSEVVSDRDAYLVELLQTSGQIRVIEQETVAWLQELRDRAAAIVHYPLSPPHGMKNGDLPIYHRYDKLNSIM